MASIRDAEEFERHRALLFALAYRMLGSAAEAEDMVQDAYLRYAAAPPREPGALQSYLCTIVTRLCLDQLKSARRQREEYIGPWLPEPVLTTEADLAPPARAEQRDSISLAFLTLLERLSPVERAALLLHDVFDYSYEETAEMVQVSVANCRQICHRARERLAAGSEGRARFEVAPELHQRLTERFLAACLHGDVQGLTAVLAQDVTVWSDGGGKVSAATRPVQGRDHTVRFIMGLLRKGAAGLRPTVEEVNGVPGILLWRGETLVIVGSFDVAEGHIQGLRFVLNPDKLLFLQSQLRAR